MTIESPTLEKISEEAFTKLGIAKRAEILDDTFDPMAHHTITVEGVDEVHNRSWQSGVAFRNRVIESVGQTCTIIMRRRQVGLGFSWGPSGFPNLYSVSLALRDCDEGENLEKTIPRTFVLDGLVDKNTNSYTRRGPVKREGELEKNFGIASLPNTYNLLQIIENIVNNRFALDGIWSGASIET